ncbi:MAG: thiamine phosphate synthase [Gammaproteobacteria bacterium]|nr:thiamine phosphate synthase [Gammaproteobacteria bacterium]
MAETLRGLYVLTDPDLIPDTALVDRVRAAIEGGASAVQYRDKRPGDTGHLERARALRRVTRDLGALLIINDDPHLAVESDADGVHLGRDDPDIDHARAVVGRRMIGVSCYNDLGLAVAAERRSADYVAFGSFHPTRTKSGTVSATPDLLRRARRALNIPIVAIGGITPDNGAVLFEAGADALAVASAVFAAMDPRQAAERFKPLLTTSPDQ